MNNSLSKSKYCNAWQCPKMLWLDTYKSNEKDDSNNDSILDNGTEVGIVAKDLFGKHTDITFNEDLKVMLLETSKLLEQDNITITEASFSYQNNFCKKESRNKYL